MTRRRVLVVASVVVLITTAAAYLLLVSARESDVAPVGYVRTEDTRAIVILVEVGVGDDIVGPNLRETADTVEITLRVRHPLSGVRPAVAVPLPYPVRLSEPLGTRRVVDGSGTNVPERHVSYVGMRTILLGDGARSRAPA